MGLFDKLLKKEQVTGPVLLGAAANGIVVPMENVPDEVFSTGVLGTCCGIDPDSGEVFAPVSGEIIHLADTLHAVAIKGDAGVEVLVHVGVDTVEMNGDGFSGKVNKGDHVEKGQLLLTMDLEKIKAANHPATVITVVSNSDEFALVECIASGQIEKGEDLMKIVK